MARISAPKAAPAGDEKPPAVQRSDPKIGDPADFPNGHGPQGDVIRIFNFARSVSD